VTGSTEDLTRALCSYLLLIVALALVAVPAAAQGIEVAAPPAPCAGPDSVEEVHPLLESAAMFLLPKILQDGFLLKEYVRSEEFKDVRRRCGDAGAVDVLFRRALRMSWNNPYATLAIMTFAILDHRRVGITLPLLGPVIWFPLTSEFSDEFAARHAGLPSRMFPDSPAWGDKDKLQHFFGSALLAIVTGSNGAVDRTGEFIEWGEDRFVVEGTVEDRDVEANHRGAMFGLRFLHDRSVLPSVYMKTALSIHAIDPAPLHEEE
jgi:hypothetical protein